MSSDRARGPSTTVLNGVQVNSVHYSGDVPPVQSRPAPRAPSAPRARASADARHSRADIVDAAIEVLDRQGLPALSMRRIADALGIQASALYWHFPDKQTLLAAVSERILRGSDDAIAPEGPDTTKSPDGPAGTDQPAGTDGPSHAGPPSSRETPPPTTWEDAVRGAAGSLRTALRTHRDGAELVSSSLALGLVDLPLRDALEGPLTEAGASPRTVDTVVRTLTHFVVGATFHEQQQMAARSAGVLPVAGASSPLDEADPAAADDPQNAEDAFARGVDLVVAGTAVLLAIDGGAAPSPAAGGR